MHKHIQDKTTQPCNCKYPKRGSQLYECSWLNLCSTSLLTLGTQSASHPLTQAVWFSHNIPSIDQVQPCLASEMSGWGDSRSRSGPWFPSRQSIHQTFFLIAQNLLVNSQWSSQEIAYLHIKSQTMNSQSQIMWTDVPGRLLSLALPQWWGKTFKKWWRWWKTIIFTILPQLPNLVKIIQETWRKPIHVSSTQEGPHGLEMEPGTTYCVAGVLTTRLPFHHP